MLRLFCACVMLAVCVGAHEFCEECGMSLSDHKNSSHVLKNGDSIVLHACSLHCAFGAKNANASLKDALILGFDNASGEFVALDSMFYVVGSTKKSAMTKESEFGFSNKNEAQKFISEFGGRIIEGREMLAYEEAKFSEDSARITASRANLAQSGEQIAKQYCNLKALKILSAPNIAILKESAKKHCENIDAKGLHAVAIYLWGK